MAAVVASRNGRENSGERVSNAAVLYKSPTAEVDVTAAKAIAEKAGERAPQRYLVNTNDNVERTNLQPKASKGKEIARQPPPAPPRFYAPGPEGGPYRTVDRKTTIARNKSRSRERPRYLPESRSIVYENAMYGERETIDPYPVEAPYPPRADRHTPATRHPNPPLGSGLDSDDRGYGRGNPAFSTLPNSVWDPYEARTLYSGPPPAGYFYPYGFPPPFTPYQGLGGYPHHPYFASPPMNPFSSMVTPGDLSSGPYPVPRHPSELPASQFPTSHHPSPPPVPFRQDSLAHEQRAYDPDRRVVPATNPTLSAYNAGKEVADLEKHGGGPTRPPRRATDNSQHAEAGPEVSRDVEGDREIIVTQIRESSLLRARSTSPLRRQKGAYEQTNLTRITDNVNLRKSLVRKGYAFGIENGEIILDQFIDKAEVDKLLQSQNFIPASAPEVDVREEDEYYYRRDNRDWTGRDMGRSDPGPVSSRRIPFTIPIDEKIGEESDTGSSSLFIDPASYGQPLVAERVRASPRYQETSDSEEAGDRQIIIEDGQRRSRSRPGRIRPLKHSRRRDPVPDADAEGWLLGIRFEQIISDPNGRQKRKPDYENSTIQEVKATADTSAVGEYVIHLIREYQTAQTYVRGRLVPNLQPDFLGMTVEIRSKHLMDMFRKISDYYPEQNLDLDTLTFPEPQRFLFHNLPAFRGYVEAPTSDAATINHTKVLLAALGKVDSGEDSVIKAVKSLEENIIGHRKISFKNVWIVYKPGTVVVDRKSVEHGVRAYIVHSLDGQERTLRKGGQVAYSVLWVNCWSICYNEVGFFTRRTVRLPVEPFQGSIDVESLDVVPLQYHPESDDLKATLILRGRKYWALKGRNYMEYSTGPKNTLVDNNTAIRVMIDLAAYKAQQKRNAKASEQTQMQGDRDSLFGDSYNKGSEIQEFHNTVDNSEDPPELQHRSRLLNCTSETPSIKSGGTETLYRQCAYMHEDDTPSDEQLMLCESHVMGYSFREKDWGTYAVDKLFKVEFQKTSFDKLVMNKHYKDVVRAMVASHVEKDTNQLKDLVKGKGQGAECIADLYERPLIAITCGDIGTNPDVLEAKLQDVFRQAEEWGAVLLLDEADVFLAERNLESLERNALVSIFLRTLEYFNGILFLTTNRIGTLDEAFQSRLHVTLGLSALSVEDRKSVWYNFLAGLKHLSKDARRALIKKSRSDWAQQPLNGRQIRNCVRTALVLARKEEVPVNESHFEKVIQLGNDYARYLTTLKKMDMDHLAEAMGTRLKVFGKDRKLPLSRPTTELVRGTVEGAGIEAGESGNVEDEMLLDDEKDFHM
ncbi:hypothetical protein DL95DRAFT_490425 [Leptodontidium sp. 2 PMI_412]|nr:hypothetical protein DL95DRAFT_490425 [Leptodontidium sp. 2 PMI_412]